MKPVSLALVLALLVAQAAAAGASLSRAETLLFDTDHFARITQPLSLRYDFRKGGSMEPGFEDTVEIAIRSVAADGTKAVSTQYLSGERQQNFPPVEAARGNPVLMYFLERDIHEMERLTGGNWRYFQKRIRLALADKARVRPVSFVHEREEMTGEEIRIAPYVDDSLRSRYERLADKYYVFILSGQIPGGVYQIRAVAPGAGTDLMEEVLTFTGVQK